MHMSKTVNHLGVPSIDLAMVDAEYGILKVTLQIPPSSDLNDDIPFLEATRDTQAVLFNGTKQDFALKLNRSGFQIGEVKYEIDTEQKNQGSVALNAGISVLREVSFEISKSTGFHDSPSASLKQNPEVVSAISTAKINFDIRRLDIYESRAREWSQHGGVTVNSNGESYIVTKDAAKAFVNERQLFSGGRSVSANDNTVLADGLSKPETASSHLNKQFLQALQGLEGTNTPNKSEVAALAVNTISQAPGFKPDQDISVMHGKKGLIVSQGEGPTSLALPIPHVKDGDFESIAVAKPTQLQQIPTPPEQQERKGPTV
jgi:hypothetical protein